MVRDTPLTNPRSLLGSLSFHALLLLLGSLVVLTAVAPDGARRPLLVEARPGPIDNRAEPGDPGGSPEPVIQLGDTPPSGSAGISALSTADRERAGDAVVDPHDARSRDREPRASRSPGSGGGAGGGTGRGSGSTTEFFGAVDTAESFTYLIDRSGSMTQNRAFDVARQELMASLSRLPPEAEFAVFVYNHQTTAIAGIEGRGGLMPATEANRERVRARLAEVRATGFTEHVAAFRAAFATGAEVVFFLTDGRDLSQEDAVRLEAEAGSSRVQAVMMGYGLEPRATDPIKYLAEATGGSYRYVDVLSAGETR